MNNIKVDVVLDLAFGDCGKGKITHDLCRKQKYTHVLRFNGGGNAGHTIFHNGKKFVTHLVPSGVFHETKSIIGPGCVVNLVKLEEEIRYLEDGGIPNVRNLVFVAKNAHVVTQEHLQEEKNESAIGTTKTGNGPAFRDKYNRKGVRFEEVAYQASCNINMIDMFHEFYDFDKKVVLAEGAQGFYLDPDWGDYPFVTSSHCGIGSVLLNGFNHKQIRKVYGAIKAYETYVGAKNFEGSDPVFPKIRELGGEYGATTGRARQCNWINVDKLKKAVMMNSVDQLIVNKVDILRQLNVWAVRDESGKVESFNSEENFRSFIESLVKIPVIFSDNPHTI